MSRSDHRPIALIGLMGAGKSAVARELGERLGTAVADLDEVIESEYGFSVAELFARSGEAWFRARESEVLDQALRAGVGVVACGGGVVLDPQRRDALRRHCRVVWLEVSPAEAARRIGPTAVSRPLLAGSVPRDALERVLAERAPLYADAADWRVATDGRTPAEVATLVLEQLEALAP
jgi:shikimate kinase